MQLDEYLFNVYTKNKKTDHVIQGRPVETIVPFIAPVDHRIQAHTDGRY